MRHRESAPIGGRIGLLVVAGAIAVVSLWWWCERKEPVVTRQPTASATDAVELDRLRSERDLLRGQVRKLGAQLAETSIRRAAEVDETGKSSAPEPPPAADRQPPSREQEMAWLMARARFLDEVLEKQPRNPSWAATIEDKARVLAKGRAKEGVRLESVSCRSTACRMEYSYRDVATRIRHIESLSADFTELPRVSYAYPGELEAQTGAQTRAIMYLATSAQPLPTLDYKTFAAQHPL